MSIHRGLAELKLIDSRIENKIEKLKPVGFVQKGKLVNNFSSEEQFRKDVVSDMTSIQDLIQRKNKIKSAIVKANNETFVKIGSKTMSIADAISYKKITELKKELLRRLESQNFSVQAQIEKHNTQVNNNALHLAQTALSKDNVKATDTDVLAITLPFIEANELKLVDPLKIENLIKELTDEISIFETEIDAMLSEINAVTIIEF